MEKCFQYKIVSLGVNLTTNKTSEKRICKYHPYIEVSAQESLCKAEKRIEI